MRVPFRFIRFSAPIAAAVVVLSGCISGNVLTIPGELSRPAKKGPGPGAGAVSTVAVLDFAYPGTPPFEIGRDFDHARMIIWKQNPGKEVPDLIADALNESGVRAVRVPGESSVPADAAAKVWGSVDRFRVDAKKTGTLKATVESAGSVAVTVYGSGGTAPAGWNSTVASDYWTTEPLFVTPEGVREAINGAANAVAEEVARRLIAAGVVAAPHTGMPERVPSFEGRREEK